MFGEKTREMMSGRNWLHSPFCIDVLSHMYVAEGRSVIDLHFMRVLVKDYPSDFQVLDQDKNG